MAESNLTKEIKKSLRLYMLLKWYLYNSLKKWVDLTERKAQPNRMIESLYSKESFFMHIFKERRRNMLKELRCKLNELVKETEDLQDEEIIKMSQKLDDFIVQEQRRKMLDLLPGSIGVSSTNYRP